MSQPHRPSPARRALVRKAGRRSLITALSLVLSLAAEAVLPSAAVAERYPGAAAEAEAARRLFEANLDAIRQRDTAAYLACYLDSEHLARSGPGGVLLGYEGLAAGAGSGWPDVFEAQDMRLLPIEPGVVYGTYRYRVRFGAVEQSGLSERLFLATDEGWKIAVTTAFPAPAGTPPPPRALVGATLVDGTGRPPVEDAVVVMRNGAIDCAGRRAECPLPDGIERLDLSGHWIAPGLVDAHVHFSQTGWADGRPDALDVRASHPYEAVQAELRDDPARFQRALLCSGVTSVFDVGGYPWTWGLAERSETDSRAPRMAAAGPLVSTLDHWLNLPAERQFIHLADADAGRAGVRYLAAHGADAVKVWFINRPSDDFAAMASAVRAVGEEARRLDLPLIVHATGLAEAKAAVAAGAHLLVHSVWDQPVDDAFVTALREAGTVYCPTLIVGRGYVRMFQSAVSGKPPAIDDPNGCVDAEIAARVAETVEHRPEGLDAERVAARDERTAERERIAAANLERLWQEGIPIAMGTDAGNPLTLHGPSVHAELEAMQAAGLPPVAVLRAATAGGAAALRRADELGTVEVGKLADLVVLAADPTEDAAAFRELVYVVRGGVVRAAEELRAPSAGQ